MPASPERCFAHTLYWLLRSMDPDAPTQFLRLAVGDASSATVPARDAFHYLTSLWSTVPPDAQTHLNLLARAYAPPETEAPQ
jgi:hypothetical protein